MDCRFVAGSSLISLLILVGCGKEITVAQCDGHVAAAADAGVQVGSDASDSGIAADGGIGEPDAATPVDAGDDPCAGRAFCLQGLTASADVIDVRERVTLQAQLENPGQVALQYGVDAAAIVTARAAGRPAAELADLGIVFDVAADGTVSFTVSSVPPWFMQTVFTLELTVQAAGEPAQTATADVTVRGNILFSTGSSSKVHAVASDGRPASGAGQFNSGVLLDQMVESPRALLLSKDGNLIVFDSSSTPPRLRRFLMDGPDVLIHEFEHTDAGTPLFVQGSDILYSIAELPDGRIVAPRYQFSGASNAPKSRLLIWQADGTFDRTVLAPSPQEIWRGVGVSADGMVLVTDREARVVTQYDPANWTAQGMLIDALPDDVWSVLGLPGGDAYVGGEGYVFQLMANGGRAAVMGNDFPTSSTHAYRVLAPFEGGRILASRNTQTDSGNIAVIDGRRFNGWLRVEGSGSPVATIYGLAYLR